MVLNGAPMQPQPYVACDQKASLRGFPRLIGTDSAKRPEKPRQMHDLAKISFARAPE